MQTISITENKALLSSDVDNDDIPETDPLYVHFTCYFLLFLLLCRPALWKTLPLESVSDKIDVMHVMWCDVIKSHHITFIYPRILRVAYAANISEHFESIRTKTRPQHRELRPLLFANSEWVL